MNQTHIIMSYHIKENQEKLERYNEALRITEGLGGSGNYAPQNSGVIMMYGHVSKPMYDHRGYIKKDCTIAGSVKIRGEANMEEAIKRGLFNSKHNYSFDFMKVLEVEDHKPTISEHPDQIRAKSITWVNCETEQELRDLIAHNKKMLFATVPEKV